MSLIKDKSKSSIYTHDIRTYRPVKMRMHSGFLLAECCLDDKHLAPFIYKYKLYKKTLSTLNIYKIVIKLKSLVLRKEDSRLVADRQACKQYFCSCSNPLEHWTDTLIT